MILLGLLALSVMATAFIATAAAIVVEAVMTAVEAQPGLSIARAVQEASHE